MAIFDNNLKYRPSVGLFLLKSVDKRKTIDAPLFGDEIKSVEGMMGEKGEICGFGVNVYNFNYLLE